MDFTSVTLSLSFLAGLASFLSPCVFALVPAYVGYLSGRSLALAGGGSLQSNRLITFTHGLAFVAGFSAIFILLGVSASVLGGVLYTARSLLTKIGGLLIIIVGLHLAGVLHIPFLEYDLRPQSTPDRSRGYLSSAMMGVFFSAGWSPCVGPTLGLILTFAYNGGDVGEGVKLLSAYSAGLAIPFLLASLGIEWVTKILRNHSRVMIIAQRAMGVVMVILGVMLLSGTFEQIAQRFQFFFIDLGI